MPQAVDYTLYLATDRDLLGARRLEDILEAVLAAGVTVVQLRDKHASGRELYELGTRVLAVTRRHGVPFIVNDRVDVMLAVDADGVHIGQDDAPLPQARRLARGKILGYSVHDLASLRQAEAAGADYVGVGPVFATATKQVTVPLLGLEGLEEIVRATRLPCVAIGGIGVASAAAVAATGVAGICVISAILGAPDPGAAARDLRAAFDQTRTQRVG